jgi:hypothetical protein
VTVGRAHGGGNVSWPCLARPIGVEEGLDRMQPSVIPVTRARVSLFDVEVGAGGVSNARTEADVQAGLIVLGLTSTCRRRMWVYDAVALVNVNMTRRGTV